MRAGLQRRAVATAALVVVLSGCATSSSSGLGPEPSSLSAELCAIAETAADEPDAAADRFSTEVHGPLHDLIDALVEDDRAAASELLDAKFAVEELTRSDDPGGEELRDALEGLSARLPGSSGCQA